MSCKLSKGNCPFCDAESGFPSTWGMSPMGWNDMKTRHDNGHPESKKCEENRADEINKLCDSAFGVGKREEKCQKEYFPVPKLPDFSGIPPIVMPCQCYAEITHLGYGCPCKCHLKEEYKCKTCGGDAFSCKGCQDSKEGWCACGEPKKEGFEYHSTDECKKCDDSIYNASAFTHDPSDCSSCLHGESAKKLREETHTVEPQPRDSYIREGLECICIGKCHCKPKEKKFYSGWGSLAEDFKIEESIPFVPETLIFNSACPATPENIAKARKICGVEESKPECDGIDPTKIVRNQYGHINIKATADACRKPKDAPRLRFRVSVEVQQSEVGCSSFRSSPFTRTVAARFRSLKNVNLLVELSDMANMILL